MNCENYPENVWVPSYRLEGQMLMPVAGQPARLLDLDRPFSRPTRRGPLPFLPPAVYDFCSLDHDKPALALQWVNRYGVLGATTWDTFGESVCLIRENQERQTARRIVEEHRVMRDCGEAPSPPHVEVVTRLGEALACDPRDLTISLWSPEPLMAFWEAWRRFQFVFYLLLFDSWVMLERHGPDALQQAFCKYSKLNLDRMTVFMREVILDSIAPPLRDAVVEALPDSPPRQRTVAAAVVLEMVSEASFAAIRYALRQKRGVAAWEWRANPQCLLPWLYVSLFTAFALPARRACQLPDCYNEARRGSKWCSNAHAVTHRKRRQLAKRDYGLTPDESQVMDNIVVAEGVSFDQAARRVVAART